MRAAISSSSSTTPLVDAVGDLASEAGLSPSLRAAVVRAAAAAGNGSVDGGRELVRRARLVRSILGLDEGETSALVNGRRCDGFSLVGVFKGRGGGIRRYVRTLCVEG